MINSIVALFLRVPLMVTETGESAFEAIGMEAEGGSGEGLGFERGESAGTAANGREATGE